MQLLAAPEPSTRNTRAMPQHPRKRTFFSIIFFFIRTFFIITKNQESGKIVTVERQLLRRILPVCVDPLTQALPAKFVE